MQVTIATIALSALKKPAARSNAAWRIDDVEALLIRAAAHGGRMSQ